MPPEWPVVGPDRRAVGLVARTHQGLQQPRISLAARRLRQRSQGHTSQRMRYNAGSMSLGKASTVSSRAFRPCSRQCASAWSTASRVPDSTVWRGALRLAITRSGPSSGARASAGAATATIAPPGPRLPARASRVRGPARAAAGRPRRARSPHCGAPRAPRSCAPPSWPADASSAAARARQGGGAPRVAKMSVRVRSDIAAGRRRPRRTSWAASRGR